MSHEKSGILLLNLGTPLSPEPRDVGSYLKEFLMDPFVLTMPAPLRWILVNLLIVPKRKHDSAKLYRTIWTERGSPLLFHLEDLVKSVSERLGPKTPIEGGMRYGEPSIRQALTRLRERGAEDILVFPLYPQYAESSTLTGLEQCQKIARELGLRTPLNSVPAFYDASWFVEPSARLVKDMMQAERADHLLLSFHSLPVSHMRKVDASGGQHCLRSQTCCDLITDVNRNCYRAQSFATARAIARAAGVDSYTVSFQSRLTKEEWIGPATEPTIERLAKSGVKRLAVACPSFVADCLETIEEIGVRGREIFVNSGGEKLIRIPCLNAEPDWADSVAEICRNH